MAIKYCAAGALSELEELHMEHFEEAVSLAAAGFLHSPPYTCVAQIYSA